MLVGGGGGVTPPTVTTQLTGDRPHRQIDRVKRCAGRRGTFTCTQIRASAFTILIHATILLGLMTFNFSKSFSNFWVCF
jgi:hypothetical protein